MPLKLIIFDLDGTLVDTSEDITNALNAAVTPFGLQPLSVKDVTALVGEGITRLIEKVLGPERAGEQEEALRRFLDHYSAHLVEHSKPYPCVEMLLQDMEGIKKAVLSNKREDLSVELLDKLGLLHYFDLVVGADTVPEKKPSALPVRYVLGALDVKASEAIIVGDSNYDIEAGKAAGLRTVAVTYGYRDRSVLAGADYLIDRFNDLVPILFSLDYDIDRRREKRYTVPDLYRRYIELKIREAGHPSPATLLDFSEHGLKLETEAPLEPCTALQCVLTVPRSLTREVAVTIRVMYCMREGERFVSGARIEEVESKLWFKVFNNILRFITERHGEIF